MCLQVDDSMLPCHPGTRPAGANVLYSENDEVAIYICSWNDRTKWLEFCVFFFL